MPVLKSPQFNQSDEFDQIDSIENVRAILYSHADTLIEIFKMRRSGQIALKDVRILIGFLSCYDDLLRKEFPEDAEMITKIDELILDCETAESLWEGKDAKTRKEFLKLMREIANSLDTIFRPKN
ncbi:MAG: hypothetical protein AAGG51_07640 [Cyanobacteria bacterium P01_G01_bin.54]